MKIALITGINGQDGSYLAELLLEKKYLDYFDFICTQNDQDHFKYHPIHEINNQIKYTFDNSGAK